MYGHVMRQASSIDTMTLKSPVSISKLPALQGFKTLDGLSR